MAIFICKLSSTELFEKNSWGEKKDAGGEQHCYQCSWGEFQEIEEYCSRVSHV
jgi:hypothetical protein